MSTSMSYCFFQNLLPELQVLEDRLNDLLAESHETVSLEELKAAHGCFEILGERGLVRDVTTKIKEAKEAQP